MIVVLLKHKGLDKIAEIPLTREEYREKMNKNVAKRRYRVQTRYLLWTKRRQIRRYNRGEVSQVFSDKERTSTK